MNIRYKSYIDNIIRDLDKAEAKQLRKAASHVARKMRKKVSVEFFDDDASAPGNPPGRRTRNLRKGIGYTKGHHEFLVGVGPPAYHAHLLEFGTAERYQKTKKGNSRFVGLVEPRPFVFPTLDEETGAVKRILSESWL